MSSKNLLCEGTVKLCFILLIYLHSAALLRLTVAIHNIFRGYGFFHEKTDKT